DPVPDGCGGAAVRLEPDRPDADRGHLHRRGGASHAPEAGLMFWLRLSALIRKELQALLRDPNGRRLLILPVILQIVLFPWAATLEVRNAAIAVLDQDRGAAAVELIQRLDAAEAFDQVTRLTSRQQVAPAIDNQTALIV